VSPTEYQPRLIDPLLEELVGTLPAVMVTGARATGKTTTAIRHAASVLRLDRPAQAEAFAVDPDVALSEYEEPILLDEWQEVPAVLGAVKRAVDSDSRPGRFLLTGSVRADIEAATWPGTGRVVKVHVAGMAVRELHGDAGSPSFFDRLANGDLPTARRPPNLREYVDLALASGFPEPALTLASPARTRWLEGYVDQVLTRDAIELEPRRDPTRLRRYFESYALNSAGVVSDATLLRAAGINRVTALAYERLLTDLFVVDAVPAWASNRLRRLSRSPKRYVSDPAVMASALGIDGHTVIRDADLLGRLLETFVTAQLRAELPTAARRPRLHHLREEHGRQEIDLIAELGGRDVFAFEVKADAAPGKDAGRHLAWLRDRIGDRFVAGVVFHTGPAPFELSERIAAVPICVLWGGGTSA
jgi:predicted AAA+ superfamily ATPase